MHTRARRAALAIYTLTIFLSALLLFSVQPMFAKMVTPLLGGASAVWAVSMCFFQVMLLLGYAWAHLLDRIVVPRTALFLQMAVLALALVSLPIGIATGSGDAASQGAYLQLIAILMAGVEDGSPLNVPVPESLPDRAWREEPIQTFMWQVQVARYWQPPFRRH